MRGAVIAVVLTGVTLATAACGAEEPVSKADGFSTAGETTHGDRVYESYRQTSRTRTRTVRLAAGTRFVKVRMDCIAKKGEISVSVFGGETGVPCQDSSNGGGYIALTKPKALTRAASTKVVVRAPRGATWSVAVDAGPGTIDTAGG